MKKKILTMGLALALSISTVASTMSYPVFAETIQSNVSVQNGFHITDIASVLTTDELRNFVKTYTNYGAYCLRNGSIDTSMIKMGVRLVSYDDSNETLKYNEVNTDVEDKLLACYDTASSNETHLYVDLANVAMASQGKAIIDVTNDDVIKSECSDVAFIMDKELLDNLLLTPMDADKKKAMVDQINIIRNRRKTRFETDYDITYLGQNAYSGSYLITDLSREELRDTLKAVYGNVYGPQGPDNPYDFDSISKEFICINTTGDESGTYDYAVTDSKSDYSKEVSQGYLKSAATVIQILSYMGYRDVPSLLANVSSLEDLEDNLVANRESVCSQQANGHDGYKSTETATCVKEGSTKTTCKYCGKVISEKTVVAKDENNHENIIEYNSNDIPEEYKDIAKVNTTNKCGEKNYAVKQCKDCGKVIQQSEISENPGHTYTTLTVVAGTCTQKGSRTLQCSRCESKKTEEIEIDKTNHVHTTIETIKDATCTSNGEKRKKCTDCGEYIGDIISIPMLAHNWVIESTVDGDCSTAEIITYQCTNCGKTKSEKNDTNKKVHNKNYIKTRTTEATCTKEGKIETVCSNCNEVISTEILPKKEHNYVAKKTEGTCTTAEKITYTCNVCGDSYTETGALNPNNHGKTHNEVTKAATCKETGIMSTICECGVTLNTKTIQKTDHQTQTVTIKEPTCTEYGIRANQCIVCGENVTTSQIAKLKHTPEVVNGKAVCSVCGNIVGYVVKYDVNGGVCDKEYDYGVAGTLVTLPTPTRNGYSFAGWYNGKGNKVSSLKLSDNITLTAKWTAKKYKITYNANGGKTTQMASDYKYGDKIALPKATRNGYAFKGWYVNGTKIEDGVTFAYNESVIAKAEWEKITLERPKIIKASSTSLRVATVKDAVGYQVYTSSNTKFNPRNSYSNTSEKIRVKKMTKGCTYIAIRTVGRDSAGHYVYSAWRYYKY